ncbi:MAG: sodium:proton antiporter [Caulobacter sp.]|nr:sodium:proton antiporter [Caulobacter sp.]
MGAFDLAAGFLLIIGLSGWFNARYFHLPTATLMVLTGLVTGGMLLFATKLLPAPNLASRLIGSIQGVSFPQTVFRYMLGLLLFAGAMQVDLTELRRRGLAIFTLATVGVVASTALVGAGLWLCARVIGLTFPLSWAMVFGVLISPTDPIAVLSAVKQGCLSKRLEAVLQGEALFNDGVEIVVFTTAVAVAGGGHPDPVAVVGSIGLEAAGGLVLGAVAGRGVVVAIRKVDDYAVEVALTLALAVVVYAIAEHLRISGPIAVVTAGLIVGDRGVKTAMSASTQRFVRGFWTLIDQILNALLFLLLGLQMLVVPLKPQLAAFWLAAIVLVAMIRFMVVLPWGSYFRVQNQERGASLLLSWGGLHGAISLALALSIPPGAIRATILSTTFAVVLASVLIQGLTFAPLAKRMARDAQGGD